MNACSQLGINSGIDSSLPVFGSKDDLKTHFITREGVYKQMTLSEYSRPNRVPLNQGCNSNGCIPVRVSFLSLRPTSANSRVGDENDVLVNGDIPPLQRRCSEVSDVRDEASPNESENNLCENCDCICFNVGRELYVFQYRGVHSVVDLNKPIDKRVYKGTYPTSHDFRAETATSSSCSLIVGFSAGQIQLIDPFHKDFQMSRLYNEDRFIDRTPVTCLKWIPGQHQYFIASHSSGNMYVYNEEFPCFATAPVYQIHGQGDGFVIYTCKTKTSRNPVYRWSIGTGSLNQFSFSQKYDAKYIATVSNDGFLRIFNYNTMELITYMKSYFGGLLCLSWSPDNRYIVTGGEDDLITVFCMTEKRVVCRGQGHRSWVSQVAFDPYTSFSSDVQITSAPADLGSDDDLRPLSLSSSGLLFKGGNIGGSHFLNRATSTVNPQLNGSTSAVTSHHQQPFLKLKDTGGSALNLRTNIPATFLSRAQKESLSSTSLGGAGSLQMMGASYRIGSVGHDTQLCLWDLTEDVLRQPCSIQRHRCSTIITIGSEQVLTSTCTADATKISTDRPKHKKLQKRGFNLATKLSGNSHDRWGRNNSALTKDREKKENVVAKLLGTPLCPRMDEVTVIEPLICKKISHDRLTGLIFREDCVVTACQEGFILTWARPGTVSSHVAASSPSLNANSNPPGTSVV